MQNCKVKTKPLYIKISTLAWTERYIGFICRFIATFNHCLGFRVSQKNSVRVFSLPQAELCRGVRHALSTSGCLLTFNPGWDQNAQEVDEFTDIREIQSKLKQQGVELQSETEEQGSGPAHIVFTDPDGNQIMIDQHR